MSPDEVNVNDQIICVMEYPEDGEQAQVYFVNYTALQADSTVGAKQYARSLAKALADRQKMTSGRADYAIGGGNQDAEKYSVNPPCMVHDCVTFYFS